MLCRIVCPDCGEYPWGIFKMKFFFRNFALSA